MKLKKPKRPKDPMELAKLIGDMSTGQTPRDDEPLRKVKSSKPSRSSPAVSKSN